MQQPNTKPARPLFSIPPPAHLILTLTAFLYSTGCASTVEGRHQAVAVNSDPPGAEVIVDGADLGTTPAVINLARHHDHSIRLDKPGYVPYEITTTSTLSNWGWAYLPAAIFPPAIFVLFADDGAFDVKPPQVTAQLVPASSGPNPH